MAPVVFLGTQRSQKAAGGGERRRGQCKCRDDVPRRGEVRMEVLLEKGGKKVQNGTYKKKDIQKRGGGGTLMGWLRAGFNLAWNYALISVERR